jgi:hypothetical protein
MPASDILKLTKSAEESIPPPLHLNDVKRTKTDPSLVKRDWMTVSQVVALFLPGHELVRRAPLFTFVPP